MSATTMQTAAPIRVTATSQCLKVDGTDPQFGDWRDDLVRDGVAIIKGAVPRERADKYDNAMYSWLEGFNLGFDRNDLGTVHKDNLPHIDQKGMCLQYAVTHEDFAWAIRGEPGVVNAFGKVYDTEDLIVSFDAINFGFPNRKDIPANVPWPHQDQDPLKPGFRCLQGLAPIWLPRSIIASSRTNLALQHGFGYTNNGMKWLEEQGYKWEKICAEPGDLLVWDSRTPHYNLSSKTSQPRFCVYTCFMPVADATQEDLVRKKDAFQRFVGTTHWPNARHVGSNQAKRNGEDDPHSRFEPLNKPVLDERTFRLTGIP
ncbi:hypothetical protein Slin14017_G075930 [Septoria linicola]|nr:hypothetical protein Slin14017_G075930 [Septoria linicola]